MTQFRKKHLYGKSRIPIPIVLLEKSEINFDAETSQVLPTALSLKNMHVSYSIDFSGVPDLQIVCFQSCLFQCKPSCSFFVLYLHVLYYFLSLMFGDKILEY